MTSYDLNIGKGSTFSMGLSLVDNVGSPIDLTNCTVSGFLKTNYSAVGLTGIGSLASLNPAISGSPMSGNITLYMDANTTAQFPINYAFYDIKVYNSGDNSVKTVMYGKASIYPDVTF